MLAFYGKSHLLVEMNRSLIAGLNSQLEATKNATGLRPLYRFFK